MTHRERVLATLRFEPVDRPAVDLMEGHVWGELQEYFRARNGWTEPGPVIGFLDTDGAENRVRIPGMIKGDADQKTIHPDDTIADVS